MFTLLRNNVIEECNECSREKRKAGGDANGATKKKVKKEETEEEKALKVRQKSKPSTGILD